MPARQRRSDPSVAVENQLQSIIKNPLMKWILIIAGIFLLVLLGIGVFKAFQGDHVKIFGIEFNSPRPKNDTIIKTIEKPLPIWDTSKVTLPRENDNTPRVTVKYLPEQNKTKKDTSGTNQTTINGGNTRNVTGNNNTVYQNDINVNTDRKLTQSEILDFFNLVEKAKKDFSIKSDTIVFMSVPGYNMVAYEQLKEILIQRGYKLDIGATMPSEIPKGIQVWHQFNRYIKVTVGIIK